MSALSDGALSHLREVADLPDLTHTKYRLIRKVARGGMGTVYLVEDTQLDRELALKVLSIPDPTGELSARLLSEARMLARLEHPNIVPVHDVGRLPDGRVFYAMKLVRGRRLDAWMKQGHSRPVLLRLFQKVCEAVAFAHTHGVIHRDLKPENIMVGSFGEALVMDWGVAKVLDRAGATEASGAPVGRSLVPDEESTTQAGRGGGSHTEHGALIGTPAYMAPEQALGEIDRLDERTDIHALGGLLYYLLSGRAPFDAGSHEEILRRVIEASPTPLRQIDPSIPKPLAAIGVKAMAKQHEARYRTAQEMADDVERFLDGMPVAAYRERLHERAARMLSHNKAIVALVLVYLVMRVALIFFTGR